MEEKYKVTMDLCGKLYVGILLTWFYIREKFQPSWPGYFREALRLFQQGKQKRYQVLPYPWTPPQYEKNSQIISDKYPSETLDASSQKCLQKIVGKFLYCARVIDYTMLMALNSLLKVQTKPTVETEKYITHFKIAAHHIQIL